jgi:predicted lipoprotein with Yx(FWY)xxD motif
VPKNSKRLAAGLVALVMLFAACGDDDDDAATDATEQDSGTDTTAAPAAEDAAIAVGVASTDLGDVLVDAEGFTLYVFDNDTPNTSNCSGQCLDNWPPALVDSDFVVDDSLDASIVATTGSPSGTQLTVNERPLYTFAADAAPGDVNGQGVGGVWWAVGTDGNAIQG